MHIIYKGRIKINRRVGSWIQKYIFRQKNIKRTESNMLIIIER